ncbi:uncharacterized protein LOC128956587 [Oppia nitens]|uniref:uncharacterized protein LOC128956587 n=1 Tax=Oppia nitens TaxID=1686743 RepID=UPI0023DA41A1|nr:uncharacterized protein LOC128956587 [Oppia nitens]
MIASVGGYYYYHYWRQYRHRQQIIGQSTNWLSNGSLSLFGQLALPMRTSNMLTPLIGQEVIERLKKASTPLYVAVYTLNKFTGIWEWGTGCIVVVAANTGAAAGGGGGSYVRVLTCAHLCDSQLPVKVLGSRISRTGIQGRVVYADPQLDMAVVDIPVDNTVARNIAVYQFTDDSLLPDYGSPVVAFGFPTNGYNLCSGIVSCPAGKLYANQDYKHFTGHIVDDQQQQPHLPDPSIVGAGRVGGIYPPGTVDIQHSAPTESGYSGGPLIDADSGQLLGINHAVGELVTFASSSNYINDLLKKADICKDSQFQRRRSEHRPIRLGVELAFYSNSCSVTDKIFNFRGNASLEPTDQIVQLNGQMIDSLDYFRELLDKCPDNQPISLLALSIIPDTNDDQQPYKTIRLIQTGLTYV